MAADMSLKQDFSSSMTYMVKKPEKERARVALRRVVKELEAVTWPTEEEEYEKLDSGIQGILDKLVAMKAGFFLSAPRECGGGHTFTNEIHMARLEQSLPSDTWELALD